VLGFEGKIFAAVIRHVS